MKIRNFLLIFFVITSISLISCNKDSNSSSSLVGKWNFESQRFKTTAPAGSRIRSSDETEEVSGTFEFKSNGTYQSCIQAEECQSGFYKKSGSTLTYSDSEDFANPSDVSIQTLTSKKLVFYAKDTYQDNGYTITDEIWTTLTR